MLPKTFPTKNGSAASKDTFIVFGKPDIGDAEVEAVTTVLRSGWLSTGDVTRTFEREFEQFLGGFRHAVAVSSCTDGLILSLLASGIGQGDEVITTPLTFAATANAILAVGATPVFVDVESDGQMSAHLLEPRITERTKAVIPVHYTGACGNMDSILTLAHGNRLIVIEDAAHGFGGAFLGQPLGTLGDFGCFSFYATKNITAGEGGMVMARTKEMAEKIRVLSMQGLSANAYKRYGAGPIQRYAVAEIGRKANLSDIHAAIGLSQLRRWRELRDRRDIVWDAYEQAFGYKGRDHAHHLFTINHPKRDDLRLFLHQRGIGTGIHFNPLHLEPAFSFLGHKPGDFPMAEAIGAETISLPVSATMTLKDAERVISAVREYGEGR